MLFRRGHKVWGTTLVELAVASFLLSILLTLSYQAMHAGVTQYQNLRSEVDMQQDALALLARLSREVAEGHAPSAWPERTVNSSLLPPTGEPVGLVFLSPRDENGRIVLDSSSGQPLWQKRVCYFFEPSDGRVYRCVEALATPSSIAPPRDDTKTTEWFKNNVAKDPLPGNIEEFLIEVGEHPENLRFEVSVSSTRGRENKILEFLSSSTLSN